MFPSFCVLLNLILLTSTVVLSSHPCGHGDTEVHADPTECQIFYDCAKPNDAVNDLTWLSEHARECPFPDVFNTKTMKCEDGHNVDCGTRTKHKFLCQYQINLCTEPLCRPCRDDFTECDPGNTTSSGEIVGHSSSKCGYTRFVQRLTCPPGKLDSSGCRNNQKLVGNVLLQ